MKKFEVYAHRGGDHKPNSLEAFARAVELGADGIETDVCLTRDFQPIIHHPGTFSPDPTSMSFKETRRNFSFIPIPHFYELLDFLRVYPYLKCLLDIKQNSRLLMDIVVEKISETGLLDRVYLTAPRKKIGFLDLSVGAEMLEYARRLNPRVRIHVIDTIPLNMGRTVRRYNADMLSFGWLNESVASKILFELLFDTGFRNISREVGRVQNLGPLVLAGIPNHADEIRRFTELTPSVDAILTDKVHLAVAVRDK